MSLLPVFLWSDVLLWLLVVGCGIAFFFKRRDPAFERAWGVFRQNRTGCASAVILIFFLVIALLDSVHYRPALEPTPAGRPDGLMVADVKARYSVDVLSLLDFLLADLRLNNEKTYSAPLAIHLFVKEPLSDTSGQGALRGYPLLRFAGRHLDTSAVGNVVPSDYHTDIALRIGFGGAIGVLLWLGVLAGLWAVGERQKKFFAVFCASSLKNPAGATLLALLCLISIVAFLAGGYHVLGTDKVGQDVLYLLLKSVRTALVIGLVTTFITLPVGIALGLMAGFFRGWVDDLVQYIYTTLSSIPAVLLIAAGVLMMQVVMDSHPQWFSTAVERADLKLLALCFILGMTSWTGLARLLRGEALKISQLEYVQAARAFGASSFGILWRHVLPNVSHIILIALVMDFSSLVLAEAVLSYVGIGVDPAMHSFGSLINNARLELGRSPVIWWSLTFAFLFMLILVLAANLFADAVRAALDPRREG